MTDRRPGSDSTMRALIEFANTDDADVTEAEARASLEAEGVDVDGFVARVRSRVAAVKKRQRLGWMDEARAKLERRRRRERGSYAGLDRAALLAEVRRREEAGQLRMAAHRNHREFTDEDLRTLLEDQDDLEDE